MDRIDNIINESITRVVEEKEVVNEGVMSDVLGQLKALFKSYFINKMEGKNPEKPLKKNLKKKKGKQGSEEVYDYDEYEEAHKKVNDADEKVLVNMIDQEKTDIAAVARDIFPDHTDEGAQSQLRKILNGERKLTDDVAGKLRKMISSGKIAVK